MRHVAKMPFGYTVEFVWYGEKAPGVVSQDVLWWPHTPSIKNDKRMKKPANFGKLLDAYRVARDEFYQDIVQATGTRMMVAEIPGSKDHPAVAPYVIEPRQAH